ncbi:heterokaryon incompatibility protein-domain-containing protein [Boeremia exigua]|uniref:heterokaryon incompatibility protein-domain-containing protein n=1 Tax=Boeremia exigua TaxID=749465 RepID=UPI001E8E29D7|nr:heterokaryon incompatibility protein-domain-containing protein [Boeremia exigua]KAH6621747.1 heterokaryon incompatibility protein-domain-containing protein [Boeremia exigua]
MKKFKQKFKQKIKKKSKQAANSADPSTCTCCKRSKTGGTFFELESYDNRTQKFEYKDWKAHIDVFREANDQGCQRCAVVFEMAMAWKRDNPENSSDYMTVSNRSYSKLEADLKVELLTDRGDMRILNVELELLSANHSNSTGMLESSRGQWNLITKPLWSEDATSDDALQESIGSLEHCLAHHKYCTNISNKLPKRCLELTQITMTLRDTASFPSAERYVCLSHCWGPKAPSRQLTSATESELRQGISLDTVPRTFSETAKVCLKMGIRFLWIDSLCIIQGDEADWTEAAATMANIYENAFFTIAATGADNSDDGLRPFKEWSKPSRLRTSNFFLREHISMNSCMFHGTHHLKTWPLLSRAWAFQEGQLSPRTLRFSCYGIVWDCRTTRLEHEERKLGSSLGTDAINLLPFFFSADYRSSTDLETAWHNTITQYSRLNLTHRIDRLPAISAMAQRMAKLRPTDTYLAGMWRSTLLSDLQWRASDGQPRMESTLPTWSWASAHGVVYDSSEFALGGVKIVDLRYTPVGPAEIGWIEDAILTIQGPALPLRAGLDADIKFSTHNVSDVTDLPVFSKRIIDLYRDYQSSTDDDIGGDHPYLALFLGDSGLSFNGLILCQVGVMYERVGYCTMYTESDYTRKPRDTTIEEMATIPLTTVRII